MSSTIVRGVVAVTGSALALTLGLTVPSAQAAAVPAPAGADPAPAAAGAAYLALQPETNGIVKTYYEYPPGNFVAEDDYGLTVDLATALDAVGGQEAKTAAITAAVRANLNTWVSTAFSAQGARAKALSFLESRNQTGSDIDALTDDLEADILTTPAPENGRLSGSASPLTQAFATSGLYDAGSALADEALGFLLQQQCAAGFFRSAFSTSGAPSQDCDGATSPEASVDTTAFAVLLLQDQKTAPAVAAALTKAADWLASQQNADGSFVAPFAGANANSTGLAGWALGISGRTAPATKAAGWLRAHQLANAGSCVKYAARDNGGIAVDDLGLTNAASGPLSDIDNDSVTRATAQGLPGLLWAAGGAAAGDTKLTGPTDFVPAGSGQTVTVAGAPGNTLCVTVGSSSNRVVLPASGTTTVPVTLPATTGSVVVSTVDAGGETDSLTVKGLAAVKLKGKAPKQVELGEKFKVKITDLQPGETVVVTYRGKKKTLTANAKGVVKPKLKANKLGTSKVKFTGEFGNRKGKVTVTVVR